MTIGMLIGGIIASSVARHFCVHRSKISHLQARHQQTGHANVYGGLGRLSHMKTITLSLYQDITDFGSIAKSPVMYEMQLVQHCYFEQYVSV